MISGNALETVTVAHVNWGPESVSYLNKGRPPLSSVTMKDPCLDIII